MGPSLFLQLSKFLKEKRSEAHLGATIPPSFKRGSREISSNPKTKSRETGFTKRSLLTNVPPFSKLYRNTPHTVTGVTPASLFLKRFPRTKLSLIHPSLAETIEHQQRQQKKSHDSPNAKRREFNQDW